MCSIMCGDDHEAPPMTFTLHVSGSSCSIRFRTTAWPAAATTARAVNSSILLIWSGAGAICAIRCAASLRGRLVRHFTGRSGVPPVQFEPFREIAVDASGLIRGACGTQGLCPVRRGAGGCSGTCTVHAWKARASANTPPCGTGRVCSLCAPVWACEARLDPASVI
jgi:hypothetical protein